MKFIVSELIKNLLAAHKLKAHFHLRIFPFLGTIRSILRPIFVLRVNFLNFLKYVSPSHIYSPSLQVLIWPIIIYIYLSILTISDAIRTFCLNMGY